MDPFSTNTGSLTLTLSMELSGAIDLDVAAVPVSISRAGQNGRYTFEGTAGQQVNVGVTGSSITTTHVSIIKPDATNLTAQISIGTTGGSVDPPVLPTTGTYAVLVDPAFGYTGSLTVTLSSEVTGPIELDGAAVTFSTTRPGQNARYTFTGTAGTRVSVGRTNTTFTTVSLTIIRPDGTLLMSPTTLSTLDTAPLPTTGT